MTPNDRNPLHGAVIFLLQNVETHGSKNLNRAQKDHLLAMYQLQPQPGDPTAASAAIEGEPLTQTPGMWREPLAEQITVPAPESDTDYSEDAPFEPVPAQEAVPFEPVPSPEPVPAYVDKEQSFENAVLIDGSVSKTE